jgi:pimeloyl-ACP methyl ester carboxylesterase
MASLVEKVTRAALGLVAAQSPGRAGEMAFWLFTRTRSTKPQSDKERKALELAKARMDESETVRLVIPGSVIATHVFRPGPGRTKGQRVLLVHGYRSRSDHMIALADALVAAGHTAVCLDLPGHGASTGRTLHLGKAVEAIDAAWRQHGPFDAFVGHSFGGPSVMAAAAGRSCMCRNGCPTASSPSPPPRTWPMCSAGPGAAWSWRGRATGLRTSGLQVRRTAIVRVPG